MIAVPETRRLARSHTYPFLNKDKTMRIRARTLLTLLSPFVVAVAAAYVQRMTAGLPGVSS